MSEERIELSLLAKHNLDYSILFIGYLFTYIFLYFINFKNSIKRSINYVFFFRIENGATYYDKEQM
jgi:hypothetical protein